MSLRKIALAACVGFALQAARSQQASTGAAPEPFTPRKTTLQTYVSSAQAVLLVHVLAGDAESYDLPVYKAKVLEVFKGKVAKDDIIYFGPFLGTRLGDDYVMLLREGLPVHPVSAAKPFGIPNAWHVINQEYGEMEVGYECTFSGAKSCDYSVRVCTNYILLPSRVEITPPLDEKFPYGCRWARRDDFLGLFREHVVR